MCNLLLTIMEKAGLQIDKFGDGTGRLEPDPLSVYSSATAGALRVMK